MAEGDGDGSERAERSMTGSDGEMEIEDIVSKELNNKSRGHNSIGKSTGIEKERSLVLLFAYHKENNKYIHTAKIMIVAAIVLSKAENHQITRTRIKMMEDDDIKQTGSKPRSQNTHHQERERERQQQQLLTRHIALSSNPIPPYHTIHLKYLMETNGPRNPGCFNT